jgi:diguanylate cyclase (GGDEF)-like protein
MNDPAPADSRSGRDEEVRALRAEIERLHAEAGRNEAVFRRTLERELAVLDAQTLPELLRVIVDGMRSSYGLEAVTLVVQDPQHEVRHMLLGDGHSPGAFAGVVFTDSVLALAPQMHSLVRPWLGSYVGADHQLLFPGRSGLASVAILPLRRGGQLVGALNFGSADPARFSRQLASDFLGHLATIVGFAFESACNRARLVRAGVTDYLTGWHNKRYLHSRLREEIARSQRHGTPLALLMMDLDHFKDVNDGYGHLSGDAAIREVASRIESEVRDSDAAARFGGDEFVVLLPGAGPAQATQAAQRIMRAVSAAPVELAPGACRTLTLSVGIAVHSPRAGANAGAAEGELKSRAEQLLAEADAALYRAKAAGRNRSVLAD